jgi:hypothetical protein
VFLPVLVWNLQHDFASFRFQTEGRFASGGLGVHHFLQLVVEQLGVLHPVLAVLLAFALPWVVRRAWRGDERARWLLAFGLPLPAYMLVNSLWIQVKMNWLAPAYMPLLLAVVMWWREGTAVSRHPRGLRAAVASVVLGGFVLPLAPLVRAMPPGRGSSWTGWEEIANRAEVWEDEIDGQDGIEGNVFFFGADYRDAAQLGRSLRMLWDSEGEHQGPVGSPDGGEPTLAQNVMSKPGLQFDGWESPSKRVGQDAIFVLPRPHQRDAVLACVRQHFQSIEKVERVEIKRLGVHVLDADIYVCRSYRGPVREG